MTTSVAPPPFILIDGSSYFFRAFHALPPLSNTEGMPTGAIYGVANMVKRLLKDFPTDHVAIVFDSNKRTFREDLYADYKAHRPPMPTDLSCQFHPLLELLEAMGIPILLIDGVEADDVIGTLAKEAANQQIPVLISTSDKDFAQLVNNNISLINTMSNQQLDREAVYVKFGVYPEQIVDYLALIGDSIDNVPGVPKCGPKTAAKWLNTYNTLENIIENASDMPGKVGENLRESLDFLPLAKQLVCIKTDVSLPLHMSDLKKRTPETDKLIQLTKTFAFKHWLNELLSEVEKQPNSTSAEIDSDKSNVTLINTMDALNTLINQVEQADFFCFKIYSDSTYPFTGEASGLSISFLTSDNFPTCTYIAFEGQEQDSLLDAKTVFSQFKNLFEDPNRLKIGHNLKVDFHLLKHYGIDFKGIHFDTMLASYLLNSHQKHDEDSLYLQQLQEKVSTFEDIMGKGAKKIQFKDLSLSKIFPVAGKRIELTLALYHSFFSQLPGTLAALLNDIEIPLLTILAEMEECGVLIDTEVLKEHGKRLKLRIKTLEAEAIDIAGNAFNLNSPKQLQEILFNQLKLPVLTKTPKGQPSTAEAALLALAPDYRLPAIILEHRSLSKLVSTYIDALPKNLNPRTSRVHTSYNQAITATGRLSSSDPNLQNIPIRSEEGRLIRKAFVAPPGYQILSADYSQIELRIMAHLSSDKHLVQAFIDDLDIHTATASEIFKTPLAEVSFEQRRRAKAINFGLIYGMSAFGLAKQLGIPSQEAQGYMDLYFSRYPGVLDYMHRMRRLAHEQGYVETLFHRRLYLPEIRSSNHQRVKAAERMAINAPMQGTAADIIKKAMISIAKWQKSLPPNQVRMIMQVHDELVFEVAESCINEVKESIKRLMEDTTTLSIPLIVSIGTGPNWDEAH